MANPSIYWDACVFHALLAKEAGRTEACNNVVKDARDGASIIYTSAITYTECVRIKTEKGQSAKKLAKENEKEVHDFFLHKWIRVVNCDRIIGEKARMLCWAHAALHPKDAIHVASAIFAGVDVMHTYDDALLKLSGKIDNLRIETPLPPAKAAELSLS